MATRVYLFRLQILIIDGGVLVLRNLLDHNLNVQGITLGVCLNNERPTIARLKSRSIIKQFQYDTLFPPSGKIPTTSDLDMTLIICLLKELKCFGLNRKFDCHKRPPVTDVSMEADIWRLKAYRNQICHMSSTTEIQETDFRTWWSDIEQILIRLNPPTAPVNIHQKISDFESCPLDEKEEKRVQREAAEWEDFENKVNILQEGMKDVIETKTDMHKMMDDVSGMMEEICGMMKYVSGMRTDVDDLKKDVGSIQTNMNTVVKVVSEMTSDICEMKRRQDGAVSWIDSIEEVNTLVRGKILPSQRDVNKAFHAFGRHSTILWTMCNIISEYIQRKSKDITSVWPAYLIKDSISSVVFMVEVKKESDLSVLKDYNCKLLLENECNEEGKLVVSRKDKINRQSYADILKQIRVCINMNADDLYTRHSNLNAILPSLKKSTGYNSGKHDISVAPCIALYVRSKGYIPLKEEPFKEQIGDFKIDVLEGIFTPFTGRATDCHQQLKIGLAIRGEDSIPEMGGTLGGFVDHPSHGLCGITCAHVLYSNQELTQIINEKDFRRKRVQQPNRDLSTEFGHVVEAVFHEGNYSSSGVDVALIKITSRYPQNGSFPLASNDTSAGFGVNNPLSFNSGDVCEVSELDHTSVLYKFGMTTEITRGCFAMMGGSCRRYHGLIDFGYALKDQILIESLMNKPFANKGDSGALVMMKTKRDMRAVGLVEGGLSDGHVFVTPICDILKSVGCKKMKMKQFRMNNDSSTVTLLIPFAMVLFSLLFTVVLKFY